VHGSSLGGVRQRIDAVLDYATAKDIRDAQNAVFPREVIEAARAHRLKDKAEAAYARRDLFNKRQALHAFA
jgi:hypothetical protein